MKELIQLHAVYSDSDKILELSESELMHKIEKCIKRFTIGDLEKSAKDSAIDIEIPTDLLDKARDDLITFGSLEALVSNEHKKYEGEGFNPTRVIKVFKNCSENQI